MASQYWYDLEAFHTTEEASQGRCALRHTGRHSSKAAQRLSRAFRGSSVASHYCWDNVKAIAYMLLITLLALDKTDNIRRENDAVFLALQCRPVYILLAVNGGHCLSAALVGFPW